jgi:tRNA nucleotidyltransferase (CCA-adding enzyme)
MEEILNKQLEEVKLSEDELIYLEKLINKTTSAIKERIKKLSIEAEVFIGGSLAKKTLLRKKDYDVDLFIRFNQKYSEEEIKKHFKKIFGFFFKIPGERIKITRIHGSRDYFRVKLKSNKHVLIEVVPVVRVSSPIKARNITDLSYFHVYYVNRKIKHFSNKKITDDIILAKSFCQAQNCYGAESYIRGFSGYAIELLILHYKSFKKFLSGISESNGKLIIDSEGKYKDKDDILKTINPSKTLSPVILVDPTFRERNVASSLSEETFSRLKFAAKMFLENPSIDFFQKKRISENFMKRKAKESDGFFSLVEIKTDRQAGDIAGTKLLKFSKFLLSEITKQYDIVESGFEYDGIKRAKIYLILSRKKEIVILGPTLDRKKDVENFKKAHPIWYIEDKRVKCALPTDVPFNDYIKEFNIRNNKIISEMSIKKVKLLI